MTHKNLFEQCKNNDALAQRALYNQFKGKLMGLCRRYTRNQDDAKDVLQETFIKIFTKIGQVESEEKLESWMKSIAVRTAIDYYNKMKKEAQSYTAKDYDISNLDYQVVLDNLSDEYLLTIINELPEGCRMVFNLFEVEGYSHVEIASLLGVTEGTSRSQLHHAKYLLKQKLDRIGIKRYEKYA